MCDIMWLLFSFTYDSTIIYCILYCKLVFLVFRRTLIFLVGIQTQ
jgi:hypothetical protein